MKISDSNFKILQELFGSDIKHRYPDFLRFECGGRLPLFFEKFWESKSKILYTMSHRKWAGDTLIQGPQMVIEINAAAEQVLAKSIKYALAIDEVIIPYEDDTRDFAPKENVDKDNFLSEWLNGALNRGFERLIPSMPPTG